MGIEELGPWQPMTVEKAIKLFRPASFRWWLAGGLALQTHLGTVWRSHDDTDIGVLRNDAPLLYSLLAGWDIHLAANGILTPWLGERLDDRSDLAGNNLWCRSDPKGPWELDILIGDGDGDNWIYRRDPKLRRPWVETVLLTGDGVPYLAPEVQLLFKSKDSRPKDDVDAATVIPKLKPLRRRWLAHHLPPDHRWQTTIAAAGVDRVASDDALLDSWRERYELPVSGWNFAELAGEITEEVPPWSYPDIARDHLRRASHVLDMGTGGGEVLKALADALPDDTVATEGWPPNVSIAAKALAPEGIQVVFYDAEADPAMPFGDDRFDLILNRHEAYDTTEVLRVLQPGGCLVTQQVDGRNFKETQQLFGGSSSYAHVTLANFSKHAKDAGMVIEHQQEWVGKLAFTSVAAMVRYFAMVPWEVPDDFSVDRYAEKLLELHHSGTDLVFTQQRFLLIARARQSS